MVPSPAGNGDVHYIQLMQTFSQNWAIFADRRSDADCQDDQIRAMETTLHRQLKSHYAGNQARQEVRVGRYRIDIVDGQRLVEVQHSGLSSLRDKTRVLLKNHDVEIIKPLIARKRLINLDHRDGRQISTRWSPKRATPLDLFHELVFFTRVFPHRRLTLRIPLIEIEECRFPWKRRNRRRGQFRIQDQHLLDVVGENVYRTADDLRRLLPPDLPSEFGTLELSQGLDVERWVAQRIAYCLRETGCTRVAGKQGNSIRYRFRRRMKSGKKRVKSGVRRAG